MVWRAGCFILCLFVFALVAGDVQASTHTVHGDTRQKTSQDGIASSGDAIVGQVIGVISDGETSLDATNTTVDSSAISGLARSVNVNALSSDAVAGQVAGVVTAAGGVADLVLDDSAVGVHARSGDVIGRVRGLTISDATSREPGVLVFTVSLPGRTREHPVTFYATTRDGTANRADYTPTAGVFTIPARESTAVIVVAVADDALCEGTEMLTVELSRTDGADIADGVGVGTILGPTDC